MTASTLTIYGVAPSSYVRTARAACIEKGVDHSLESLELGSKAHLALHPFGKVPIMKHGDVSLIETSAICRYIDEAFDGPALLPESPTERARAERWMSLVNCYLYRDLVVDYLLPMIRQQADMEKVQAHVPTMKRDLDLIEAGLNDAFLAGAKFSLADAFVGPLVAVLANFPHTGALFESMPNTRAWISRLQERESGQFLYPPRP